MVGDNLGVPKTDLNCLKIPIIYLKDKQAFSKDADGMLRLIGKPLDVAKNLKARGYVLLHIIDSDALSGITNNLDVYDGLTYNINVEVECAPSSVLVMKLLSFKCRAVLPLSSSCDVSKLKEKKLLVAKIARGYTGSAEAFHEVILEPGAVSDIEVKKFSALGKRVIVHENEFRKLNADCQKLVWGVLTSSF